MYLSPLSPRITVLVFTSIWEQWKAWCLPSSFGNTITTLLWAPWFLEPQVFLEMSWPRWWGWGRPGSLKGLPSMRSASWWAWSRGQAVVAVNRDCQRDIPQTTDLWVGERLPRSFVLRFYIIYLFFLTLSWFSWRGMQVPFALGNLPTSCCRSIIFP